MAEPAANPPTTLIGAGTTVATGLIAGLSGAPGLLLIILLNSAFIIAAAWFMLTQEGYRHDERVMLGDLLKTCILPGGPASP